MGGTSPSGYRLVMYRLPVEVRMTARRHSSRLMVVSFVGKVSPKVGDRMSLRECWKRHNTIGLPLPRLGTKRTVIWSSTKSFSANSRSSAGSLVTPSKTFHIDLSLKARKKLSEDALLAPRLGVLNTQFPPSRIVKSSTMGVTCSVIVISSAFTTQKGLASPADP